MKKAVCFLIMNLLGTFAFAQNQSFDLYAQGKVVESVFELRKELKSHKYSAPTLNSQYQRLLSAYRMHAKINDEIVIEILNLMLTLQPAVNGMEFDVSLLLKEIQHFQSASPSLEQAANYLDSSIVRGKDTSIISNDPKRLSKILMTRIYASRKAQKAKGAERAAWLFLAGKAGFYRFNTGNADLKHYIQLCEHLKTTKACSKTRQARSMLDLGLAVRSPHSLPPKSE